MPVAPEIRRQQWREAQQRRRAGIPPRENLPCGTDAAARRHRRAMEPLCPACAQAERDAHNRRRAINRSNAGR